MQQQRRYEAVQEKQKDEAQVVEEGDMSDTMETMNEDAMETDQPSTSGKVTPNE